MDDGYWDPITKAAEKFGCEPSEIDGRQCGINAEEIKSKEWAKTILNKGELELRQPTYTGNYPDYLDHLSEYERQEEMRRDRYKRRKKESYRKAELKRRIAMHGKKSDEEKLRTALMSAAVHAVTISVNRSVVPEANVRLGDFVTSLRRELKDCFYTSKAISHNLCSKTSWTDILVPCTRHLDGVGELSGDEVAMIVESVRLEVQENKGATGISVGLKCLDKDLKELDSMINTLNRFGEEGEKIKEGFVELADLVQG